MTNRYRRENALRKAARHAALREKRERQADHAAAPPETLAALARDWPAFVQIRDWSAPMGVVCDPSLRMVA